MYSRYLFSVSHFNFFISLYMFEFHIFLLDREVLLFLADWHFVQYLSLYIALLVVVDLSCCGCLFIFIESVIFILLWGILLKTNSVIWTSFVAMYCVFVLYSFVACCDFVFFLCEVCVMFFSKSTKFDNGIKGNVVTNKSAENLHLISKSNQIELFYSAPKSWPESWPT